MNTKRRALSGAMALALAGGVVVTTALPTSAAEQDLILSLDSGQITIGETVLELPNGDPAEEGTTAYEGTWDDVTGDLAGDLTVPTIILEVDNPLAPGTTLPIHIDISQVSGGTGNIDPATGDGTLSITTDVLITSPDAAIGPLLNPGETPTCGIDGITMDFTVAADLEADPVTASLTGGGFFVPAATGCGPDGGLNAVVNGTLGIEGEGTENTSADLQFTQTNELPPPPAPTTTTTAAPTTTTTAGTGGTGGTGGTPARPVAARPAYTG